MPNICCYDMKVVGKKENVEEFIKVIQANYDYNKNEFSFDRHLWRVFEANIIDTELREDGNFVAMITGNCAWSVYTSMTAEEHSYYDDYKIRKDGKKNKGSCLENESKNLNLNIEVFSTETDIGFQEHLIIKNGETIINNCKDYADYSASWFDDNEEKDSIELLEDLNQKFNTNYKYNEIDKSTIYEFGGIENYGEYTI